jgi:ABC-type polysaccharide/polyol phosphate export permease
MTRLDIGAPPVTDLLREGVRPAKRPNPAAQYFDLVCHLIRRDFQIRYTGSLLGIVWSVLIPLVQLLVMVFVFGSVVPLGIEDYPAFVFSALLPWTWFSTCIASAGALFTANRYLLRQPRFHPATLVLINTLSNLVTYLVSLPILLVMLALHGRFPTAAVFAFPLLLLLQTILLVGLGLVIAVANVFYRDIQHICGIALSLIIFLMPVFYRPEQVRTGYQQLLYLNPIAVLIQSYRDIFFYQRAPQWPGLLYVAAFSLAMGVLGYIIYSRQLSRMMDSL